MPHNLPDDRQRASDEERDEAVTRLRTAFAEGRLDQEEHERRVAAAFGATTHGELQTVLDDLPAAVPREAAPARSAQDARAEKEGSRVNPLAVWGIFTAVMFVLWAVPALVMGYPMGVLGWGLFCGFWGIPAFVLTLVRRRGR